MSRRKSRIVGKERSDAWEVDFGGSSELTNADHCAWGANDSRGDLIVIECEICNFTMPSILRTMATQLVQLPEVERLSSSVIRILGGNPGKVSSPN